ncbi:MAG: DUF4416 family protein [Calditrichaeota bacterium]|nr:DUF4416 family protein [Calditrichota bacterium]
MKPTEPTPVKLICGVLYSDEGLLQKARKNLEEKFSRIDYTSKIFPFDVTDYYVPEMGAPIHRLFYSFHNLLNPKQLAQIKIDCNEIEEQLAVDGQRKVNIDPGYLDYDKFVLASAKYNAHKIYLDLGIYADLTLTYRRGHFIPSQYCFPDFKNGVYEKEILFMRAKYKGQLRKMNK